MFVLSGMQLEEFGLRRVVAVDTVNDTVRSYTVWGCILLNHLAIECVPFTKAGDAHYMPAV